jgi:zinc transport system substrate-binding protein
MKKELTLLPLILLVGCTPNTPNTPTTSTAIPVSVSIEPQKYFVERIGGEQVAVNVMIPPGAEPHTYEPKPEQLKELANARAFFTVGVSLEDSWKERLKSVNTQMLVVDTSQGVEKLPLEAHAHNHGAQGLDPHIWLSPQRVKTQAENIYKTLVQIDPAQETQYTANWQKFQQDLQSLDREIRQNLQPVKNRKFMVFHPEWGYFAKDYGLEMVAIEVEGNEPSASQLKELIQEGKEEKIKVIFVQPEFSTKSSETIAKELGAKVIPISAFAGDWSNNLREVSQTMGEVLK